jgi:hypothetical protein
MLALGVVYVTSACYLGGIVSYATPSRLNFLNFMILL